MLEILPSFALPESELEWSFSRAGGPGGQNVNKVATRATVRLRIVENPAIPEPLRERLVARLAARLTKEGELIVAVDDEREQSRNRELARERLAEILRRALEQPKQRRATRRTRGSVKRRLESKRRRSSVKEQRRRPGSEG